MSFQSLSSYFRKIAATSVKSRQETDTMSHLLVLVKQDDQLLQRKRVAGCIMV